MRALLSVFVLAFLFPTTTFAGKDNCRLNVRTVYIDPSDRPKLEVYRVPAATREECHQKAEDRKTNYDHEKIKSVTATYSFSEPN